MTTPITLTSTVVASNEQVSNRVEAETVVLSLSDGVYYGLNPLASRIWTLIQEPATVADVCETIRAEYDVPPATCERDVIALLAELAARDLVVVR